MAISGFLFISWRIGEIIITTPIVGMLGWFVHKFNSVNQLTPVSILVLFIVATLALAWCVFTLVSYLRARHDALFVAFVDLLFVGAFIGGVVVMRGIAHQNCSNLNAGITTNGSYFNLTTRKGCAMQKASFALAIIDILLFVVTFFLALWVAHHHRNDGREREVVIKRTHHSSSGRRRSGSRDYRSSRDYRYDDRPRSSSGRHSRSRQYYV